MKTRLLPTLACILLATITTFAQPANLPADEPLRQVEALHLFTEPGAAFPVQVSLAPVVAAPVAELELEIELEIELEWARVPAGMIRSDEQSRAGKSTRRWALLIGGAAAVVTGSAILLSSGGSGGGTSLPSPPQRP